MERFKFTKEERVTGEKRIEALFSKGRSFIAYPFRIVYLETTGQEKVPLSILISVPKKRMKSAVARNRMKRLSREAYRLNKHEFFLSDAHEDVHIDMALICVADKPCDYNIVEKGMRKALKELNRRMEEGCSD